jgi:putative acetyltransferase
MIRAAAPQDHTAIFAIWQRAIDATHDFITPDDRRFYAAMFCDAYLPQAPLSLAIDDNDGAMRGFIGLSLGGPWEKDGHIDALFIDPDHSRRGWGRALVEHAVRQCQGALYVEANEQNQPAVRFYDHLGFARIGRSEADHCGRPYPLIIMRRPALAFP